MALLINPYRFASGSPATFFQGGTYKGFWIDASDTSTLKQDTGGTTAVTADGDPVGYVAEKSGAGGVFTRMTGDTQRPLYKVVSGYPCLRFDGSNDGLLGDATVKAFSANGTYITIILAVQVDASASYGQGITNINLSNYHVISTEFSTSSEVKFWAFNSQSEYSSATPTSKSIYTFILRSDNTYPSRAIRINGSSVYSGAGPESVGFGSGSARGVGIGRDWEDGGTSFYGDIYQAFVINRELTGTDLTSAEQALAAKAGITI